jgi:uncharacterized protein
MKLPTYSEIENLHRKSAPTASAFNNIFTHSNIVKDIAEGIIMLKNLNIDDTLVRVGALLHDIGAYTFIDNEGKFDEKNYIQHGIRGYSILKREGFPEIIARFAERHTGVGLPKEEVVKYIPNLPPNDYVAETMEEKLIMYSDKFHSKTPQFNSFNSYSKYVRRFGEDKVEKFAKLSRLFGIPDLEPLAEKYHHSIV